MITEKAWTIMIKDLRRVKELFNYLTFLNALNNLYYFLGFIKNRKSIEIF